MAKSTNNSSNHPLRVFEAFAGIGAQNTALRRLNLNYEIVGISEWYVNALKAYDALNCDHDNPDIPSHEDQIKELKKYTFSRDSVKPIKNISKLSQNEIENLYLANLRSKNKGSITEIKGDKLEPFDLLIYSFPCQDLSTGGKTMGMKKNSGTRSGLLWEVERILRELKKVNHLPEYLLMENVKAIYAPSNKEDLDAWLSFLESIGYKNGSHLTLNAVDFGIPQNRKRAFIISHLGTPIDDSKLRTHSQQAESIKPFLKLNYKDKELKAEADEAQLNKTMSRKEMWNINGRDANKINTINTITCNMDRSNTAVMFKYKGPKGDSFRLLTMREAFLFMGFTEDEYSKVKSLGLSYRQMNKLIGNSIVVNVLMEIFRTMFGDRYNKKDGNANE